METHVNFRTLIRQLIPSKNWTVVFVIICLAGFVSVGFAQETVTSGDKSVSADDSRDRPEAAAAMPPARLPIRRYRNAGRSSRRPLLPRGHLGIWQPGVAAEDI